MFGCSTLCIKKWASFCDYIVSCYVTIDIPWWNKNLVCEQVSHCTAFIDVEAIKLISCSLLTSCTWQFFIWHFFYGLITQSCVMAYLRQTCSCSWLPLSHSHLHKFSHHACLLSLPFIGRYSGLWYLALNEQCEGTHFVREAWAHFACEQYV